MKHTTTEHPSTVVAILGRRVTIEHTSTTDPKMFVGGALEVFSALIPAGRLDLGGLGGRASEKLCWATSRDECIAKATAALRKRPAQTR